jgi:methanethiol S-methyltransferase
VRLKWIGRVVGFAAIAAYTAFYAVELNPSHEWPPLSIRLFDHLGGNRTIIAFNIVIIFAFLSLAPFRKSSRHRWGSQGIFVAFMISVVTEMFGLPLVIFLLSPIVNIPLIGEDYFYRVGHYPVTIGAIASFLGLALIAIGWIQIHSETSLAKTGLYKYVRHPQYAGFILFTFGWILHWPTIITILLWPILVSMYAYLSVAEDAELRVEFGPAFTSYAANTKRFIPFIF